jgi:predicted dehydrogenase
MPSDVCRWGILGTATIARKTWQGIHRSGNARLVAVASREMARSRTFIAECQSRVPVGHEIAAVGDYEGLLRRPDVDAVYIPLPTGLRKEWVLRAAEAGKHVLCEKPCGNNAADLKVMVDACRKNGVQFMDGVMYMHTQRLAALRQSLDEGDAIGRIKRIACQFSFNAPPDFFVENIRSNSSLEPQGCLGDLGWYTIRFALWAMNWQMPTRVVGRLLDSFQRADSPEKVPTEFSAELFFPTATASFYCSFRTHHQQWAVISGEQGYILVQDFVLPFFGAETRFEVNQAEFIVDGCDFSMEQRARKQLFAEHGNSHATSQETNLIRNFSALVISGRLDEHWPRISMLTQQVMDACLESGLNGGTPVELKPSHA